SGAATSIVHCGKRGNCYDYSRHAAVSHGRARGTSLGRFQALTFRGAPMYAPLPTEFDRITRLPPYVFNITSELKMAARRRGEDVIDFGMGNPDGPTPRHILDKLTETVQRGDTHGYSMSKGIPRLRRAICAWYQRRFNVTLDPETEAIVTIGSKEGIAH